MVIKRLKYPEGESQTESGAESGGESSAYSQCADIKPEGQAGTLGLQEGDWLLKVPYFMVSIPCY